MRERLKIEYHLLRLNLKALRFRLYVALGLFMLRHVLIPLEARFLLNDNIRVEFYGTAWTPRRAENAFDVADRNAWHHER